MPDQRPESSAWGRWIGLVVVVGVFLAGAASFLPRQCLWGDETTQMIGLRLGPIEATRWLAGGGPNDPDQIRDRMPPLSYWMGSAWARVFGLDERSLRWFGVACVALAVALVYEAARRAFGTASAWGAGLLFALCPAVIVLSVEIRSYPLFLLWSALAFHELVRLVATPGGERWTTYAALAFTLSAAVITHFFGAVLGASILGALLLRAYRGEGRLRPVLFVGGTFALSLASLYPFVGASVALSRHASTRSINRVQELLNVKNMLVRLVNDVSLTVHPPVAIVALTAALVLLGLTLCVARSRPRPVLAVAVTLGTGLLLVTAAKLVQNKFDASSYNYNAWMRPGFCILLSAGLASGCKTVRRVAAVAFFLLLVSQASGIYELNVHGDYFVHGPQRAIVALVRSCEPRDTAMVHDDRSHRFVVVYCPIRCELGAGLEHYRCADATAGSTLVRAYPGGGDARPVIALPHRYLVVVRSEATNPTNLAAQVRGGDRPLSNGPLARALRASDDWRLVTERTTVASISAKIDVFERRRPPRQAREGDIRETEALFEGGGSKKPGTLFGIAERPPRFSR